MMHDELKPGAQPPPNAAICPTCMQMRVAATDITFEMRRRLGVNARTAAIINRAHNMGAAIIAACSSWDSADLKPTPVERLRLYAHGICAAIEAMSTAELRDLTTLVVRTLTDSDDLRPRCRGAIMTGNGHDKH